MKNYIFQNKKWLLFLFFGGINFAFSYFLFLVLWMISSESIGYLGVIILNIMIATFFSYLTQAKWVWKSVAVSMNAFLKYVAYQFALVPIANYLVPKLTLILGVNLIFVQLGYSLVIVFMSWFFLKNFIYKDGFNR
jgi:hypothetical protein